MSYIGCAVNVPRPFTFHVPSSSLIITTTTILVIFWKLCLSFASHLHSIRPANVNVGDGTAGSTNYYNIQSLIGNGAEAACEAPPPPTNGELHNTAQEETIARATA
jgi:hypothetical protein